MKEYFVCSDIHGFYDIFFTGLINAGFDYYNSDHYIIICGDIFDRGSQAKELLKFLLEFQQLNRLILIRGNHEDLIEDCLNQLEAKVNISHHH
jgi:serine/threonine protein phosphatase 1